MVIGDGLVVDANTGTAVADYGNAPLWFLRDLMVVVLFTPLIWWVLKRTKYYAIACLACLWLAAGYFNLPNINFNATALMFFSFGAYMSINRKDMLVAFGKHFRSSTVLYIALGILQIISQYFFPDWITVSLKRLNIFVGLIFAYNLAAWLVRKHYCKPSPFLAAAGFFIYLSHTFLIGPCIIVLSKIIHPASDSSFICIYLITTIFIVALLLTIFHLLRTYCPKFLKIIAGRK